jgi:hypothetical protein
MSTRGHEAARAAGLRAEVQGLIEAALAADFREVAAVDSTRAPDEP